MKKILARMLIVILIPVILAYVVTRFILYPILWVFDIVPPVMLYLEDIPFIKNNSGIDF